MERLMVYTRLMRWAKAEIKKTMFDTLAVDNENEKPMDHYTLIRVHTPSGTLKNREMGKTRVRKVVRAEE